jgi:hypothetical protein
MACCGKARAVQRLKTAKKVALESTASLGTYRALKDKDPASLPPKLLLDYHHKTHMLYGGAIKRVPPNKKFINSIVDIHDKLVNEMLKQEMKHNTPLKKI